MERVKMVGIGFAAGLSSGLLGIGGALIMVPCMVYFLGLSQHSAAATSLAVVIPGALISASVYGAYGQLDLGLAGLFAVGGMIGAYIGSTLLPKVKPQRLKQIFAVLLMLLAIKMGVTI